MPKPHSRRTAPKTSKLAIFTAPPARLAAGFVVAVVVTTAYAWHYRQTAPSIMVTSNSLGSTAGGTMMVITGHGFTKNGATQVLFGNRPAAAVTVAADTTIVATAPAHEAGSVTVTVINPDGRRATVPNGFTYSLFKPVLTSLSPSQGPAAGGTIVTLKGAGFMATPVKVRIHTTTVTPTVLDDSTLTFVTPPSPSGSLAANVMVMSSDAEWTSDNATFTYK